MRGNDRKGNLRPRREKRVFRLGNYIVVTDTEATEKNYLEALRDSIPPTMRGSLNIQVINNIKTGQTYEKADKEIYKKLNRYGDEKEAIRIAETKYRCDKDKKPSEMLSVTTLHQLIKEIKDRISNHE
jgi:hypothetical protein